MRFQIVLDVGMDDREAQKIVNNGGVILDTQEKALLGLTLLVSRHVHAPLRELLLAPDAEMPKMGAPIALTTEDSPTSIALTINPGETPCPTSAPAKIEPSKSDKKRGRTRQSRRSSRRS